MLQPTIKYKTYLLEAIVEALGSPFAHHPDPLFKKVKVTSELPTSQEAFPSVVIKFYERRFPNAGIAHKEIIRKDDGHLQYMGHRLYKGQLQFMTYALSSLDRAYIMDALIQIITMAEFEDYSNAFLARIYSPGTELKPAAAEHWITLNSDDPTPIGGNESQVPWLSEDLILYQDGYRIEVFGEVYSRETDKNLDFVSEVTMYPFLPWETPSPGDPDWGTPWSPSGPPNDPLGEDPYEPADPFQTPP